MPLTVQLTAVFVVPLTVAENCCVWETCTDTLAGDTVTEIAGGPLETSDTIALADFDVSTVLITDTVIDDGEGSTAGAVYSPFAEMVPTVAFPPLIPSMFHVTPDLEAGVTFAAN